MKWTHWGKINSGLNHWYDIDDGFMSQIQIIRQELMQMSALTVRIHQEGKGK